MQGPLVMAAEGIKSWDEATIAMGGSAGVQQAGSQFSALKFAPDYDANRHVTHYFRLLMPGEPLPVEGEASAAGVDDSRLKEAMALARSRRDAQNAWNALEVKVPEYAPWARHGYARLMDQFDRARALFDDAERSHSQEAIDKMTTDLNAALNTMRPGNLPELEDLDELLPLLNKAKQQTAPGNKLREAIDYAEMVVKYVSDGSGTADMIERATRQLKDATK